jgi:hypothetical protein
MMSGIFPADVSLLAGVGCGLLLATQLLLLFDLPKERSAPMSVIAIPDPLMSALQAALAAKADADTKAAAKSASAIALTSAQGTDAQAATDLGASAVNLNAARQTLEAAEDAYLQPGAAAAQAVPSPAPIVTPPLLPVTARP